MAGGFTSPAPWLGISASPVVEQGGYYTLPWWQAGGAPVVDQGGYYTLPWWQAGGNVGTDPVDPVVGLPGGGESRRRIEAPGRRTTYEIALYEDEEIIAVLQAMLSRRH